MYVDNDDKIFISQIIRKNGSHPICLKMIGRNKNIECLKHRYMLDFIMPGGESFNTKLVELQQVRGGGRQAFQEFCSKIYVLQLNSDRTVLSE